MQKMKKIALLTVITALSAAAPVFSQDLQDLQNSAGHFSAALAKSLPFNTALGLNWADAYIGKVFPGMPPHFGAGFSLGYTTMDFSAFEDLMGQFGFAIPGGFKLGQMVLPAYTAEARVGGFFLPFDMGFKFGFLNDVGSASAKINYTLVGGEIRYALLEGGPILPAVSLGVGLNHLKGEFTGSAGSGVSYGIGSGETLDLSKPTVGLQWETLALDLKAQVSKSFLIITPYLGFGVSHAWSSAGYSVEADVTYKGAALDPATKDRINAGLKSAGVEGIDFNGKGIATIIEETGWSLRGFGGLSINLALFRLDLTGLYNFFDHNYGITLGTRFQL
jgi:hypothetical protein